MPIVTDAWDRYLTAAEAAGLDIAANFTSVSSADVVVEAFRAEGIDAPENLVEYFTVIYDVAERDANRIFPDSVALGLPQAIAEHRKLLAFAVEAAEGQDPEPIYASTRFSLTSGKPTTLVDRQTGQVAEQWWDEDQPRPIADSLADWLDQRTAELEAGAPDLERFARTVAGTAPIRVGVFEFHAAQFWLTNASVHVLVHDCSRVVVRHLASGSVPGSLGFEQVHADLVADLLVGVGVPREVISFQVDDVADRAASNRGKHGVWLDGYDE